MIRAVDDGAASSSSLRPGTGLRRLIQQGAAEVLAASGRHLEQRFATDAHRLGAMRR